MADTIPRRDVVLTTRVGLEHSRLSRRLLLQRGGAAALGLGLMPTLLAACGGDDRSAPRRRRPAARSTSSPGRATTSPTRSRRGRRQRRRGQGDLHRQPRRDPGQAEGGRRLRLRHHHVLPGLQAALHGARHPASRSTTTRSRTSMNLFPYFASGRQQLLGRRRRHATGVPWTWGSIGITYDDAELPASPTRGTTCSTRSSRARSALSTTRSARSRSTSTSLGYGPRRTCPRTRTPKSTTSSSRSSRSPTASPRASAI